MHKLIHRFLMQLLNISQLLKNLMNLCFILNTAPGSKSISLTAAIHMSPGCTIRLAFFWVFLPCFCMLFLSLPLLRMSSKSTSLSPAVCVLWPRQYNMIYWKLGLIFGFFVFPGLLFGRMGSVNEAGVL